MSKKFTKLFDNDTKLEKVVAAAYLQIDKFDSKHFSVTFKPAETDGQSLLVLYMYDVDVVKSVRCNEES